MQGVPPGGAGNINRSARTPEQQAANKKTLEGLMKSVKGMARGVTVPKKKGFKAKLKMLFTSKRRQHAKQTAKLVDKVAKQISELGTSAIQEMDVQVAKVGDFDTCLALDKLKPKNVKDMIQNNTKIQNLEDFSSGDVDAVLKEIFTQNPEDLAKTSSEKAKEATEAREKLVSTRKNEPAVISLASKVVGGLGLEGDKVDAAKDAAKEFIASHDSLYNSCIDSKAADPDIAVRSHLEQRFK